MRCAAVSVLALVCAIGLVSAQFNPFGYPGIGTGAGSSQSSGTFGSGLGGLSFLFFVLFVLLAILGLRNSNQRSVTLVNATQAG